MTCVTLAFPLLVFSFWESKTSKIIIFIKEGADENSSSFYLIFLNKLNMIQGDKIRNDVQNNLKITEFPFFLAFFLILIY